MRLHQPVHQDQQPHLAGIPPNVGSFAGGGVLPGVPGPDQLSGSFSGSSTGAEATNAYLSPSQTNTLEGNYQGPAAGNTPSSSTSAIPSSDSGADQSAAAPSASAAAAPNVGAPSATSDTAPKPAVPPPTPGGGSQGAAPATPSNGTSDASTAGLASKASQIYSQIHQSLANSYQMQGQSQTRTPAPQASGIPTQGQSKDIG